MLAGLAITSGLLLLAVWVVYPAVIAWLARGRRARTPAGMYLPAVSVVIATRENAEVVRARVRGCLDTDYPLDRLDIVVAHDGAAGVTFDEPAARAVAGDAPGGKAAALNAGVRAATGEVLVFADAHQSFRRDTIPRLVAALEDPTFGAVSGRLELPSSRGTLAAAYWSMERRLRCDEAAVHSAVGATGAVWAMRRDLWAPLPSGLLLDDLYTPMRIVLGGRRVGYVPEALAIETRQPTPGQEYGRKVRTLTGVMQLCAWLPAVLWPQRNPIWAQFVFHKLLRMLTPYCLALIVLWAVVRGLPLLGGAVPYFLAGMGVILLWLTRTRTRVGTRIRRFAVEGTLLQAAVIVAGVNGFRRNWQVWNG